MRTRLVVLLAALVVSASAAGAATASSSTSAVAQIKAVYKTVLTAEYFGPASGVCSHLTAAGVKSFTAGGTESCTKAFEQNQHVLKHKTKGDDDSGFTPGQWRTEVNQVMAQLKVTVHGTKASAIGGASGIPGNTNLVETGGKWLFTTYPPSISS